MLFMVVRFCVGILMTSCIYTAVLDKRFFVGNVKLSPHIVRVIDALPEASRLEVINSMNQFLEDNDLWHQDLFKENINESIARSAEVGVGNFKEVVRSAIQLTSSIRQNSWYKPKTVTEKKNLFSSFSFFTKKAVKSATLSELIDKALAGDASVLLQIHIMARVQLKHASTEEKFKILKLLEEKTLAKLEEINQRVYEENELLNASSGESSEDLEKLSASLKHVGILHTANQRAIIKISKDILRALRPMCSSSQRLMFTIDRHDLNPLINMLDMRDFDLRGVDSEGSLRSMLERRAQDLADAGLLKIPKHVKTKPEFFKHLENLVVSHHPQITDISHTTHSALHTIDEHNHDARAMVLEQHLKDINKLPNEYLKQKAQDHFAHLQRSQKKPRILSVEEFHE